jgi:hypothetical protein
MDLLRTTPLTTLAIMGIVVMAGPRVGGPADQLTQDVDVVQEVIEDLFKRPKRSCPTTKASIHWAATIFE